MEFRLNTALDDSKEKRALALAAYPYSLKHQRVPRQRQYQLGLGQRDAPIVSYNRHEFDLNRKRPPRAERISKSLFWEERSIVKPARRSAVCDPRSRTIEL